MSEKGTERKSKSSHKKVRERERTCERARESKIKKVSQRECARMSKQDSE